MVTICSAIATGPGAWPGQEAIALDALIGLDPQHAEQLPSAGTERGAPGSGPLVQDNRDIRNPHARLRYSGPPLAYDPEPPVDPDPPVAPEPELPGGSGGAPTQLGAGGEAKVPTP
jgi:hypothetical protein